MQILAAVGLRERAAEDREVLSEEIDQPRIHRAVAADDAVAGDGRGLVHAEVAAAVGDEGVDLDERAGVEEQLDALAGGELARRVLLVDALLAAAQLGRGKAALQLLDLLGADGCRRGRLGHGAGDLPRRAPISMGLSNSISPSGKSRMPPGRFA